MSLSNVVGASGSTFFGSVMAQVGADRANGLDISSGILRSIGSSLIGQAGSALAPERTASGTEIPETGTFSKAFFRGFLGDQASGEKPSVVGEKLPQNLLGDGSGVIGGPAPGTPSIFIGEPDLELLLHVGKGVTQEQATQFVGMSLDDAVSRAEANGWQSRVSRADGEQYVLTMDFRSDRINFEVSNGVVTDVKIG